jgi:energy-coupling factor transport system permease protein
MNDKVVFGQYVNVNSWIHRLDPRTKIITLFLMMVGIFFISNIYALLAFLVFNFINWFYMPVFSVTCI